MTLTKAVVDAVNALSADAGPSEIVSRIEKCQEVHRLCEKGLEKLKELCLPPVKPRWADLPEAGPGVRVSNYEVQFRETRNWQEYILQIIEYDATVREETVDKAKLREQILRLLIRSPLVQR